MAKDVIIENINKEYKLRKDSGSRPRCDFILPFENAYLEFETFDMTKYAPIAPTTLLEPNDEIYENGTWKKTQRFGLSAGIFFQYRRPLTFNGI